MAAVGNQFMVASAKCREFVDFLSSNGIGREIELPQIAVIGDTSSGKSSLLSALSGIELPSSSELTTRCPTRLRMETQPNWRCVVRIIWKDTSQPVQTTEVKDQSDLTEAIRTAQASILKHESVLEGKPVEVSKSVVEVQVYGPTYADLTLIDLPGFVRMRGSFDLHMAVKLSIFLLYYMVI